MQIPSPSSKQLAIMQIFQDAKTDKKPKIIASNKLLISDTNSTTNNNLIDNQMQLSALTYPQLKLANFIQLQLTDLKDTAHQLQESGLVNNIKQNISRAFNACHELQKLYSELKMDFLYEQTKKLVQTFGIMFVHIFDKIDKLESQKNLKKDDEQKSLPQNGGVYIKDRMQLLAKQCIENETTKGSIKKFQGIHLYNQTYSRHMDYDIEMFRNLKEKQKNSKNTPQELQKQRKQEDIQFKKSIYDQLNDISHLTVDNQDITEFLTRQKYVSEQIRSISLGDQLQKIAKYFKQSENHALDFLRKSKNTDFFHELSEGFHSVVEEYSEQKNRQTSLIKKKFDQILNLFEKRSQQADLIIEGLNLQIKKLKEDVKGKIIQTNNMQIQTFHNFDEEIRQLFSRIVQQDMVIEQMKRYIKKSIEQENREKDNLFSQIQMREGYLKEYKELLNQKANYSQRLQRKIKLIQQSNKNKNCIDPINYFDSLDKNIQKSLIEQLKQRGIITYHKQVQGPIRINKTKHSIHQQNKNLERKQLLGNKKNEQIDYIEKRIMKFDKKRKTINNQGKKEYQESRQKFDQFYPQQSHQTSKKINFNIEEIKFNNQDKLSALKSQSGQIINSLQHQGSKKSSRRVRKIKIQDERQEQKPRVFQITDRSNFSYSQSYIQLDELKKNQKSKQKVKQSSIKSIQKQQQVEHQNTSIGVQIYKNQTQQKQISNRDTNNEISKELLKAKVIPSRLNQIAQIQRKHSQLNNISNEMAQLNKKSQIGQNEIKVINKQKSIHFTINKQQKLLNYNHNQQTNECQSKNPNSSHSSIKNLNGISQINIDKVNQKDQNNLKVYKQQQICQKKQKKLEKNQQHQKNLDHKFQKHYHRQIVGQFQISIRGSDKKLNTICNSVEKIQKTFHHSQTTKNDADQRTFMKLAQNHKLTNSHRQAVSKDNSGKVGLESISNKKNDDRIDKKYQTLATKFMTNRKGNKKIEKSKKIMEDIEILKENRNSQAKNIHFRSHKNSLYHQYTTSQHFQKIEQSFYENIFDNQPQIIQAAQQQNSIENFQNRVAQIHYAKCGANCSHLKRYVQGFKKLRKIKKNRKSQMKIHIENMNNKFDTQIQTKKSQFPLLNRK